MALEIGSKIPIHEASDGITFATQFEMSGAIPLHTLEFTEFIQPLPQGDSNSAKVISRLYLRSYTPNETNVDILDFSAPATLSVSEAGSFSAETTMNFSDIVLAALEARMQRNDRTIDLIQRDVSFWRKARDIGVSMASFGSVYLGVKYGSTIDGDEQGYVLQEALLGQVVTVLGVAATAFGAALSGSGIKFGRTYNKELDEIQRQNGRLARIFDAVANKDVVITPFQKEVSEI